MRAAHAIFSKHFSHVFSPVALGVDLTAVADEGHVLEVQRVVGHVIHAPQHLLIPGWQLVWRDFLVALHIDKSGSGMHAGPLIREVRADVPRTCSTHAEACKGDAIFIHVEACRGIIPRLKHICLARTFPAIAVATEGMDHNRALGLKLPRLLGHQSAVNEVQIGRRVAAPMQPDPHGHRLLALAEL